MKLGFALLASLLASCCAPTKTTGPHWCVTPCGMTAVTDCAALDAFEARAVQRLGKVRGWSAPGVCSSLKGWRIVEMAQSKTLGCYNGWLERQICVVGYTRVFTRTVAVLGPGIPENILAHELIHVVDYRTRGYPGHCDWKIRGVAAALKDITGDDDLAAGTGCPDHPGDGGL